MTAHGAGKTRGKHDVLTVAFHRADSGQAIGQSQCCFERFRETQAEVGAYLESIHHNLDVVLALLVEVGKVVELGDDAIDAGAHEAGGAQFLENMQVFALARPHHRRQ